MDRNDLTSRMPRGGLAVMLGLLLVVLGACTPPTPTGPRISASLAISTDSTMPGLVQMNVRASGFPTDPISPNYDAEWTARDEATHAVVASSTTAVGNGDGTLTVLLQPGLFTATISGSTATIQVGVDITMHRAGATASRTVTRTLSWTMPAGPLTAALVADNSYSVQQGFAAVCSPIGTQVHVAATGELSFTAAGFIDFTVPFGSNFVPLDSSGNATLSTTTECWSPMVMRASFAGGLTGTTNFTISWSPPAA